MICTPGLYFTMEDAPEHLSYRQDSPHQHLEPLYARKHKVSCDFKRPNITLQQQPHCNLQSLPCKSHYIELRRPGLQTYSGSSHYSAICAPELYFTSRAFPTNEVSSHRRRVPLYARKHRTSCDFLYPSITLTQQFHCNLQPLSCK